MKWCTIISSVDSSCIVHLLIAHQVNKFREVLIDYYCNSCTVTMKDYHIELAVKIHAIKEKSVVIPENRKPSLVQQPHMEG